MKSMQLKFRNYSMMVAITVMLSGQSVSAFAKDNGCWAEFYEYAQFIGDKFRLDGPAGLPNLRNVEGENWDSRIDSIVVGPKAKVIIFENVNYKLTMTEMAKFPVLMRSLGITEEDIKLDSELIFSPKQMVNHLGQFNFHKKTKSLKVECVK